LRLAALVLGAAVTLATAPAGALANTATSSNWSGYAAHRSGVRFRRVSGSWTQPSAACTSSGKTFSSFWVGLGGFSGTSGGLEQIGSELDCNLFGQQQSSLWYELVPAPSRHIHMMVKPGDSMRASVTVTGNRVFFRLVDSTRGEQFTKRLTTRSIDLGAAEWITEAPSTCDSSGSCQTLPLTDYGSAHFTRARAQTVSGHNGRISDPGWDNTRLVLSQSPSPFTGMQSKRTSTPGTLGAGGSSFVVHYGQSALLPAVRLAAADARGSLAVQPGGIRR
jgi:hypothetical protein